MEALVNFTIDQIGLEGPNGCSVQALFTLLSAHLPLRLGFTTIEALPPEVRRWLWDLLLKRTTEIGTFRKVTKQQEERLTSDGGSCSTQQKLRRRKNRACIGIDAATLEQFRLTLEEVERSDVADLDKLNMDEIHIVATQTVRDRSLGIFVENLTTFGISQLQRIALEVIGKKRRRGALRTELSKMLQMDPTRFHYVLQLLEGRGLVVSSPILHNNEGAKEGQALQSTSIIHLRRFAPKLLEGQIFKEVSDGPKSGVYGISDDNRRQLKRICERLSKAQNKTLVESDLKLDLGFRLTEGHRAWRRLRGALETSGHIRVFQAYIDSKPGRGRSTRSLVELLKPYETSGRREEEEEEDDWGVVDCHAEKGFEWQVMDLIVSAGPEGILKHKLCRALGVSMKRISKRIDEVKSRFGIIETDEQDYRQIVKKWRAPDSMLELRAKVQNPPQPKQGFTGAVVTTLTSTPLAADLRRAHLQAREGESPGPEDAASPEFRSAASQEAGAAAQPSLDLTLDDLPEGLSVEPSLAGMLQAEPSPEPMDIEMPEDLPIQNEVAIPNDMLDSPGVILTNVGVSISGGRPHNIVKFTGLAAERLEKLVAKVEADQFMLRSGLQRFFLDMAPPGLAKCSLDRKTCMRVVDRALILGKLQHYCLTVPPQRNGQQVDRIFVLLKGGLQIEGNHQLIREIRKANREKIRDRTYVGPYKKQLSYGGPKTLPNVDRLRSFPERGSKPAQAENDDDDDPNAGTMTSSMWENGFIQARMIRARVLHGFLCQLIGLAGCSSEGLRNCIEEVRRDNDAGEAPPEGVRIPAQQASGPLFSFFEVQRDKQVPEPKKTVKEREVIEKLSRSHRGLFTWAAMWSSMPLDLYCQIVGTSNSHHTLEELILKAPRMGELSQQQHQAIVDVQAKKRLNNVLDILVRLRLIKSYLYSDNRFHSRSERSIFILLPDVQFEEPKGIADDFKGGCGFNTVEFDLRTEEDLESYWNRLEYASNSMGAEMAKGVPGMHVPEINTFKGWAKDRMMPMHKWIELKNRVTAGIEDFTWEQCRKAANDLGLDYERVHRIAQHIRLREGKLRARKDPEYRLPALASCSGKGRPQLRTREERRATARLRYRQSKLEWRQQLPSKSRIPTVQRPWDPSEETLKKRKREGEQLSLAHVDTTEDDLLADEYGKSQAVVPSRLSSRRFLAKKFQWLPEEDRFLLIGFVKWHALMGFKEKAFRSQQRPMKGVEFKERQAWRRMQELTADKNLEELMIKLNRNVEEVHRRAHVRGDQDRMLKRAQQLRKVHQANVKRQHKERREHERAARTSLQARGDSQGGAEDADGGSYRPMYGSLVLPFPRLGPGRLFDVQCEQDAAAHARIEAVIEQIIAAAPRRVDEEHPTKRIQDIKRKMTDGMYDAMPPAKRGNFTDVRTTDDMLMRGPERGGFKTIEDQLQRMVSKTAQSRTRLLLEDEAPPLPTAAAAAELIKVLLSASESGVAPPDSEVALVRRFTEREISAAFAYLRRRNFVYHGGSRKRFNLAIPFKTALQVPELPSDLFEEAAVAARRFEGSDTGIMAVSRGDEEVPAGLVAEVLGMALANTATLSLPPPEEEALPEQRPADDLGGLVPRSVKAVQWEISAELTQVSPAIPSGLHMRSERPSEEATPRFDPGEVLRSEELQARAWEACAAACEGPEAGCDRALLERMHGALKLALADGPTLDALASDLREPVDTVEAALALLQLHGLVCRVPGYSTWCYVTSPSSIGFFSDPLRPAAAGGEAAATPDAAPVPSADGATTEEAPRPKRWRPPLNERGAQMLAPWLDHKGGVNEPLWRQLVSRVMAFVICSPGISEDDIVAEMSALTPCSTKRLLDILLRNELLMTQHSEMVMPGPPRLFGGPAPKVVKARHFFIDVRAGFSQINMVQPI